MKKAKERAETPNTKIAYATIDRELRMRDSARDCMDAHVRRDTRNESGGVLVGTFDETTGIIEITDAIPATKAIGSVTSLTFTHDSWDEVNEIMEEKYSGKQILGWFHSHPHFGVFLSEYDTFIHRNFFGEPWQIAYVIDPLLGTCGFFGWEDGEIVQYREWDIRGTGSSPILETPVVQKLVVNPSARASKVLTLAGLFLLSSLVLLGIGYYFGASSGTTAQTNYVPNSNQVSPTTTTIVSNSTLLTTTTTSKTPIQKPSAPSSTTTEHNVRASRKKSQR